MRNILVYTLIGAAAFAAPAMAQTQWPTYDLHSACTILYIPRVLPGVKPPMPDERIVKSCVDANEHTKKVLNNSYWWENIHEDSKRICAGPYNAASTYTDFTDCLGLMEVYAAGPVGPNPAGTLSPFTGRPR